MDSGARAAAALPAVNTYRTLDEPRQGRYSPNCTTRSTPGRPPCAAMTMGCGPFGMPGCYAATWGDGSWQLVVPGDAQDEMITKKQWTARKKQLSFGEVTQDGDQEGILPYLRPAADSGPDQMIRDILGIRKRVELSPGQLENVRRWSFEKGARKRRVNGYGRRYFKVCPHPYSRRPGKAHEISRKPNLAGAARPGAN